MQAIRTKYFGPTNHSGSRIIATAEAGRVIMPYRHELNIQGNHEAACEMLKRKLGWIDSHYPRTVKTACGGLPDGSFAHVIVEED